MLTLYNSLITKDTAHLICSELQLQPSNNHTGILLDINQESLGENSARNFSHLILNIWTNMVYIIQQSCY